MKLRSSLGNLQLPLSLILFIIALFIGASPAPAAKPSSQPTRSFKHGSWPFHSPKQPAIPDVKNAAWVRNAVDNFILAKLEAAGISPSAPADKATLLRRVTFDLTGLPPTLAEQRAFLTDDAPDAYEKLVDRLLASPRYGERWAQHWLDVVRFAETDGFKEDAHRPDAHKYRDYVIRALNDDLPYDRFIRQQLAGDETEPENPEALIATGLNRLYPDEYNANNVRKRRQEILDDITDVTGLAFLGLTMGCAQCHDHKFDDILQADYYRLQAFFTPMLPRDDLQAATPAEQAAYRHKLAAWEEVTAGVREEIEKLIGPAREKALNGGLSRFEEDVRAMMLKADADRTAYEKQLVVQVLQNFESKLKEESLAKSLKGDDKKRYEELQAELATFAEQKPKPLPTIMGITDAGRQAPPQFRYDGGDYRKPLDEVQPGFPQFLGANEAKVVLSKVLPDATGRRTALANWLARGDHPLTGRIMMNRVWLHHFGEGIVATPNDFGLMGGDPSHPELLDWLAVEFVNRGWSLKAMHRLMVTSATYRQASVYLAPGEAPGVASSADAQPPSGVDARTVDPTNRLLWHFRRQRLEAEAIRDSALSISGRLNDRMFGPSAKPSLPKDFSSSYAWKPDAKPEDRNRRSIYVLAKRNLRFPFFDAFDWPDLHNSCAHRSSTTTAPQAFSLLNSDFMLGEAKVWREKLLSSHPGDAAALVRAAYQTAFAREASAEELSLAQAFLASDASELPSRAREEAVAGAASPTDVDNAEDSSAAGATNDSSAASPISPDRLTDFCHALLCANEFLYVD